MFAQSCASVLNRLGQSCVHTFRSSEEWSAANREDIGESMPRSWSNCSPKRETPGFPCSLGTRRQFKSLPLVCPSSKEPF